MTYGTSYLLIGEGGGGEYSQGEGQEKILLYKGGHNMKKKNIGGCVLSTQPDQQKSPPCKNAQKMQKFNKHRKSFPRSFRSLGILHFFSGAAYRHAPVQYAKYVFIFFFLSGHHDTNPLLHLYHFRKKNIFIYWLILTVNHQGSYFPSFLSSSSGSNIFIPQQIL